MPRQKKKSAEQRKIYQKERKRENRKGKEKFEDGLNVCENSEDGLNLEKKSEDGLNFPKKSEHGLNFPKKSEDGLNFPKKSENGLNFPKKSEVVGKFSENIAEGFTEGFAEGFAVSSLMVAQSSSDSVADRFVCGASVAENYHDGASDAFGKKCSDSIEEGCSMNTGECRSEKLTENLFEAVSNRSLENMNTIVDDNCTGITNMNSQMAARISPWSSYQITLGNFHQNDERFSLESRGFQCTANALCMLSCTTCFEAFSSSTLDMVLYDGDALYKTVTNHLKTEGKFVAPLLSLEEIPDTYEVGHRKFRAEKGPVTSGVLIETVALNGLPTLHSAIQSAFLTTSSALLIIGAICSAVFKKNNLFYFFDSHSHGQNGLSSNDGSSVLISFTSLEDLVTYLYAFYDSMALDMSLQFDLLPLTVHKHEVFNHNGRAKSLLESYFHDQESRQQKFADMNIAATVASKKTIGIRKKKKRTEYYAFIKRQQRKDTDFQQKEKKYQLESKQSARKKPGVLARERAVKKTKRQEPAFQEKELMYQLASKQSARKKPAFQEKELKYQLASKQSARKKPGVLAKERAEKEVKRQETAFREKEHVYQLASKQYARKKPGVLAKERAEKEVKRQETAFREKERVYQLASKQYARKKPGVLAKERADKEVKRQETAFREKEHVYQLASKQSARKKTGVLAKESAVKAIKRQEPAFKRKELVYQLTSKQSARKKPFVLDCERIKQQEKRQKKRKLAEDRPLVDKGFKRGRKDENLKVQDMYNISVQKNYESVDECIKRFHKTISTGPVYICTCCHQTWFEKSVSALKTSHVSARCVQLYCTKLKSVNNEEWICHTCLSALKQCRIPKLSVANGMKWPDKPTELDLHQLEERLIALRIPFMQIRELPRGGQYSLKGNVINVPVDIQPTVNSLPRPMDENFTIAVQLKKKLSYKKVDFKENVRPVRVLTALHWLINNSDLYKKSGIITDEKWLEEVTKSTKDNVKAFLEAQTEQSEDRDNLNISQLQVDSVCSLSKDEATDGYESDGFSEIDCTEHIGNVDTMVDDAAVENKVNQILTFAPGEGQHPLSLYQDKDAEYLCFPTIFCGQRRPDASERITAVHYSDIVKWELRSADRRAAQSVPNLFFKHKKIQMKQISDKVNLALRRCKNKGKKMTAAEVRNPAYMDKLVRLDEGYYIFRQLRNSPAYLESRKKDIFAMIRQLSLPTWFMSLSAADTRWNDLLKMLAKLNDGIDYSDDEVDALTWQDKTRLVQKDPVTCSRYFDHRVQEFMNTVLKCEYGPIGKVADFFYRVEFQQRGSPHIHMLVWIENAPKFEKNSDEEIIQFVDQYLTCSTENDKTETLVELQTHKHSKTCRKKGKAICRFGYPLPPFPNTMLLRPLDEDVDKYKKKYSELQAVMNEYKGSAEVEFPEFLDKIAKMDFEEYIKCVRSSLNAPKVFLKRKPNEMRINLYNTAVLLGWKANLDIQIVLEPYGCAAYVVGYMSKSQRGMSAQLDAAAREARKGNSDLKKQVRHIGNVFSNCVEVSAQEAVYLALQIPLTKGSRDVVFINTSSPDERVFLLKPKSVLDELPAESTEIESNNVIQRYSKRPRQLQKFCLADYVSTVDVVYPKGNRLPELTGEQNEDNLNDNDSSDENDHSNRGSDDEEDQYIDGHGSNLLHTAKNGTKFKRRKKARIIRYVRYNKNKDSENYFREQLLLFMPWRNEAKDLIGSYETYEAHYNSIKPTLEHKRCQYEHHIEELELAKQMAEVEEDAFDEIAPATEQDNREAEAEGEKEAAKFVYFNPDRVVEHRQYDIGIEIQGTCSVPSVEIAGVMLPDDQYLHLVRSLNLRQREFFNHVLYWIKCEDRPMYAFLSGGAGVGKSVLIKAIYQSLYRLLNLKDGENPDDIRILLCAYTGKAAYNINGVTIASAFLKKFKQGNDLLSADELNTFRVKYRHLKVVIIDEISMVGRNTLNFLNTRLQQLTGTKAHFGGLSIIAVGDLYQLMPVCDKWIFNDLSKGASALACNLWKDLFRLYELVDIMRQKDDVDFAQLLNRLRLNELTEDDKNELKKHIVTIDSSNYPKDAPHLFTENRFVDKHNTLVLNRLAEKKVAVPCHDTVVSANISAEKCKKLIETLPEDSNKTANMQTLLTVAVGMIYDITVNINVEDGLTNGSTCVVKFIEYKLEGTTRPSIIWVLFEDPQIGKLTREKYCNRGFYNTNIKKEWTPIFDIERTFVYNHKHFQRVQFPLKPSAGKTVHKAQGSTVDEIVVDLSQTRIRKQPHIHYVALSRVRKLDNLHILNLNEEALAVDEQVKIEMQRFRSEALLELCYVPLYKVDPLKMKIAFNNARSFHKHFKDIEFEPNVLSADVIGFAESRLCTRDADCHFVLNKFKLVRLDDDGHESVNRPYHGLVLYIKEYFHIQRIQKFHSASCEFIFVALQSKQKGFVQVACVYRYPKGSQSLLRNDIVSQLLPLVDLKTRLVIIGDFNINANDSTSHTIDFIMRTFKSEQLIKRPTTDYGSLLDMIFSNCPAFTDVIEAYWTDHRLIYCALNTET